MDVKILFINACKFENNDVRTTADVLVGGQAAQLTFTTVGTAAAKQLAAGTGLPEPTYSGKSGVSKMGKHKGMGWKVFTCGAKPGTIGTDEGEVDFN